MNRQEKQRLARFVGEKIVLFRSEANLSQEELAERVQLDKSTICRYETGHRMIDYVTLRKIANELGITIDDLIPEVDE